MPANYCSVPLKFPNNSDLDEFNKIVKNASDEDYKITFKFVNSWRKWIHEEVHFNNEIYSLVFRVLDGLHLRLAHAKEKKNLKQKHTPDDLSLHYYNHILKRASFEQINEVRNSLCVFLQDMDLYQSENGSVDLLKIVRSRLYTFANHQLRVYISPDDAITKNAKLQVSARCLRKYEIEHGALKITHGGSTGVSKTENKAMKTIKELLTQLKEKL